VDAKFLDSGLAAAMTGGAMLTVLLFPMLALLGRSPDSSGTDAEKDLAD
jgi:hypothetical protein